MTSCMCSCSSPVMGAKSIDSSTIFISSTRRIAPAMTFGVVRLGTTLRMIPAGSAKYRFCGVRASVVDSYESDFAKRMERAWLIAQQPMPVSCSSCDSEGHVECKWCRGTGFFIIGDNMLCQVPSRNTTCVICAGKGSMCCADCKGTGFRAKWMGDIPK